MFSDFSRKYETAQTHSSGGAPAKTANKFCQNLISECENSKETRRGRPLMEAHRARASVPERACHGCASWPVWVDLQDVGRAELRWRPGSIPRPGLRESIARQKRLAAPPPQWRNSDRTEASPFACLSAGGAATGRANRCGRNLIRIIQIDNEKCHV